MAPSPEHSATHRPWLDGLWQSNPALIQLLGLCPLLAISNTAINALALGLATLMTLVISNTVVSLLRNRLTPDIRIPAYVLIIASTVTSIDLLFNAYLPQLHQKLGLFIPLIVTNCMIIARAETVASRTPPAQAALDGLSQGLGFLWVLLLLGSVREWLGHGTLLRDADWLFGSIAADWTVRVLPEGTELLIALLPPGAFIALGLILAIVNMCNQRRERNAAHACQSQAVDS